MARRHDTTPDVCDKTRLRWLQKQLRDIRKDREQASEDCSHSAVAAFRREERALRDLIDAGRLQIAAAENSSKSAKVTPEERAQMLRERVDNASDEELEVAVQEWLRRRKYELRVLPDGGLTLIVEGDYRPDLRLVEG
jgi:predicted metal-dependent hydrolase